MPLLYETTTSTLETGEVFFVGFEATSRLNTQDIVKKLMAYNWLSHGLNLLDVKIEETCPVVKGTLVFESLKGFFAWVVAIPLIITGITVIGGVLKLWLAKEILSPWIKPGPLGLPMIVWILVAAAGVLIPVALILRRK